jgi:hypothetical protein
VSGPGDIWDRPPRLIPDELALIDRYVWLAEQAVASKGLDGSKEQALAQEIASIGKALARAREAGDVEGAVSAAFWIGRLAERTHWRFDNVRETSASPEELARERVGARRALAGRNEGRDEANRAKAAKKAEAARYARELAAKILEDNPSLSVSKSRLAERVRARWELEPIPSLRTLRRDYLK